MTFASPADHLAAELQRLTLLLHREILRLRAAYQLSQDEFRGLYVSDEQVDHLVDRTLASQPTSAGEDHAATVATLTDRAEAMKLANAVRLGEDVPWARLTAEWQLSEFEHDVLLLALAPEIDPKFETLYAYLNNDVTRKWPTCHLAMRLFATASGHDAALRRSLLPESPLFRDGLLHPIRPANDRPGWLSGGFSIAPVAAHFLLGVPSQDSATLPFLDARPTTSWHHVPISAGLRERLQSLPELFRRTASPPLIVLEGRRGSGRLTAARAICSDIPLPLLRVDLEGMRSEAARSTAESLPRLLDAVRLQRRLTGSALYLTGVEALYEKDGRPQSDARRILIHLMRGRQPVFLAVDPAVGWREVAHEVRCAVFHFADPDYPARRALWRASLADHEVTAGDAEVEAVSSRFLLTPGQIRAAVGAAADHPLRAANQPLSLIEAARAQSGHGLAALATKVPPGCGWDDLVLPAETLRSVREVAAAVRDRHVVYTEWGFADRVAAGQGLKVLFAGPSGTGKTMTAGVIAADLGLDLYRIDLSSMVSKYIGETEKNMERVFRAAHHSNAAIFFDECDALFGKRSEVKDAHDRYANIETAYLLQRIEEHEGVVILASNLGKNIDDAFRRRLHYVVEFPLPDEPHREKLWRGMFPARVPLGEDVDFPFLAKQFPLAGGDIRNVALDAAFLAAADGRVITMKQVVRAVARQMLKQGTVPAAMEFKQYYGLLADYRS